ncbi:metal-sulfur cluster assembly factor [Blastococcus brunescens]|uniref:Iron-sulfur cluster assembly protein n=1 Tax=Blastococcus brunescens TaxID=1564165 RepID=A0ABZ1B6H4_9ACTN|nr:iron-sulfur cluster assembly protein [Blastococcus sp. BMG 8361]WRL65468.1 iron-sulfur cluster assembly protein [Blastococcus sp. BMG 8361]
MTDPELPMVSLADLGVLRDVRVDDDGTVVVEITPTYTGCPAMGVMRADLVHALHRAGFPDVDVRTVLSLPGAPTGSATRAAASSPSPVSRRRGERRCRRRVRSRCSWAPADGRRTARCAARPTPRS